MDYDKENEVDEVKVDSFPSNPYPRRQDKVQAPRVGLKKKQRRAIFIAGIITGVLLSSTLSLLLPDKKVDKTPEKVITGAENSAPAVEKPQYTEPLPIILDEEKEEAKPEALLENLNHSYAASEYAHSIEDVNGWMSNGRDTDEKLVFLTFDDGPGVYTKEVLDILKEKETPATFFLLGNKAEKTSSDDLVWKRYIEEGHGIALHGYSHDYDKLYTDRSPNLSVFEEELGKSRDILAEKYGEHFKTRVFRFPGGSMSWKNMDEAKSKLAEQDIYSVDWNAMSGDSEPASRRPKSAEESWTLIKDNLNRTAHPETVVLLMHDTKEDTVKYLGEIIEKFKSEGYKFGILY